MCRRWLGIDFSGNHRSWRIGCDQSNVWLADVREIGAKLQLVSLQRVQHLRPGGAPFEALVELLKSESFLAAAIDAPFSIPLRYLNGNNHAAFLDQVGAMQSSSRRVFPTGGEFVSLVVAGKSLEDKKPLRATEKYWKNRGLNVRSTLWCGARGGAAMTVASLTLLKKADIQIWPWALNSERALLVEAFPAAQLLQWKLPFQKYNGKGSAERANRQEILRQVSSRISVDSFTEQVTDSADAIDAVLCAFAAIAVTESKLAAAAVPEYSEEGWIAVHQ